MKRYKIKYLSNSGVEYKIKVDAPNEFKAREIAIDSLHRHGCGQGTIVKIKEKK